MVKGDGLKHRCESFVGSNPTSSTYSLKLLKYAIQQNKTNLTYNQTVPCSIQGEAKTYSGERKKYMWHMNQLR